MISTIERRPLEGATNPLYSLRQIAEMLGRNVSDADVRKLFNERGIQYLRKREMVPADSARQLIDKLQQERRSPKMKAQNVIFARVESKIKNVK
jgi:hypothetical protein